MEPIKLEPGFKCQLLSNVNVYRYSEVCGRPLSIGPLQAENMQLLAAAVGQALGRAFRVYPKP
jgi:hypothetical protein